MEIRRLSIWMAFLLVAAVSQNSEARHSIERRDTEIEPYDDFQSDDAANETEQNSTQATVEEAILEANILTPPTSYNITVGQSVRLECRTDTDAVVDWTINDSKNVVVNSHLWDTNKYIFDENNGDLVVRSVEPSDSGTYRCKVQQQRLTFVDHRLVVSEKPKIVSISASDLGRPREGSDLVLTCLTSGVPQPQIIWSVQETSANQHLADPRSSPSNRKLTEHDGTFTHNTVTIRNVKREQSGTYYCYVFSTAGSDTKAVVVSVSGKPRVHVHKTAVNSAVNVEAILQCSVHEELPIEITWYLNDAPLYSTDKTRISTQGSRSNLTVIPESDADFGIYACRASNEYGHHSRSVQLVQTPVIENLDADGAKLTFKVHSHQALEKIEVQLHELSGTEWIRKDITVPGERHHEYEITYEVQDLKPNKYEVFVKVQNNKGWSDAASTVINIAESQQIIQGASVYRHGNGAALNRPTTVMLSTVLMYLLVRML